MKILNFTFSQLKIVKIFPNKVVEVGEFIGVGRVDVQPSRGQKCRHFYQVKLNFLNLLITKSDRSTRKLNTNIHVFQSKIDHMKVRFQCSCHQWIFDLENVNSLIFFIVPIR